MRTPLFRIGVILISFNLLVGLGPCKFLSSTGDDEQEDTDSSGDSEGSSGESGGGSQGSGCTPAPSYSTNRQLWLEAASLSGSYTTGQTLATWNECGGGGRHADQGTGSLQPAFYSTGGPNNGAYVRFDGTDDFMSVSNGSIDLSSGVSIISVVKLVTSGGGLGTYRGFVSKGYTFPNRWYFGTDWWGGSSNFTMMFIGSTGNACSTGLVVDAWMVLSMGHSGSSNQIFNNGGAGSNCAGSGSFAAISDDLIIGAKQTAATTYNAMRVDVAEIIIYNEKLSHANRVAVECQLKDKYGISGYSPYGAACP